MMVAILDWTQQIYKGEICLSSGRAGEASRRIDWARDMWNGGRSWTKNASLS